MNLWNIYAKYYDALRSNPISSRIHQNEQNSLQNLISMLTFAPKSGHALDLGCGSGVNLHYIPDHYSQIVALDKSAEMVAIPKINMHRSR